MAREGWYREANCASTDPEVFFGDVFFGRGQHQIAKKICERCPVIDDCLSEALTDEIEHGTWGGMTGPERLELLRDTYGSDYKWPTSPTFWADWHMARARPGGLIAA